MVIFGRAVKQSPVLSALVGLAAGYTLLSLAVAAAHAQDPQVQPDIVETLRRYCITRIQDVTASVLENWHQAPVAHEEAEKRLTEYKESELSRFSGWSPENQRRYRIRFERQLEQNLSQLRHRLTAGMSRTRRLKVLYKGKTHLRIERYDFDGNLQDVTCADGKTRSEYETGGSVVSVWKDADPWLVNPLCGIQLLPSLFDQCVLRQLAEVDHMVVEATPKPGSEYRGLGKARIHIAQVSGFTVPVKVEYFLPDMRLYKVTECSNYSLLGGGPLFPGKIVEVQYDLTRRDADPTVRDTTVWTVEQIQTNTGIADSEFVLGDHNVDFVNFPFDGHRIAVSLGESLSDQEIQIIAEKLDYALPPSRK